MTFGDVRGGVQLHAGEIAKANITPVIGHLLRKQDCRGVHLQVLLDVSAVGLPPA